MLCLDGKRRRPKREFVELKEMKHGEFYSVAERVWKIEGQFVDRWTTVRRLYSGIAVNVYSAASRHRLIGWHGLLGAKS